MVKNLQIQQLKQVKILLRLLVKKIVHKIAEATGDLTGNKIADKITSASKKPHNEDEVINGIPKERYISPKEGQKIIRELKLA